MGFFELMVILGLLCTAAAYSVDLFFLAIGCISIKKQMRKGGYKRFLESNFPALTILVPCFNEEKGIMNSIKYLKQIDYPKLTIIIINDGSFDSTFDILKRELRLIPYSPLYNPIISTQQLKQIYKSNNGNFIVLDKVNGGKADSLNAGLNLCKTDLVCCVDADTIIKKDALKKLVMPFLEDPRVAAAGGNVRLKNDSDELKDFPSRLRAPWKILTKMQVIEYTRSVNIARNALAAFNANLIISGAFGVFKTDILEKINGYEKFSKGEDFELVTRIHLYMRQKKIPYRICQVYAADSFTDGPNGIKSLKSQRKRWQVALVSTLRAHLFKFFKYLPSSIALFSLPYYTIFETIFPIAQVMTYLLIPLLAALKIIGLEYFFYLLIAFVYSSLINLLYMLTDFNFCDYYERRDKFRLILISLAEPFFYHQMNCYWKLLGMIDSLGKIFVKATWTPPRGEDNLKSQYGCLPIELNLDTRSDMRISVDYKSLYDDRIVIISLSGRFEMNDIKKFADVISYLKRKKRKRFILEMKSLTDISSAALSNLVELNKSLKKQSGSIVILNPYSKISDQLKISNAIKEIKIYKNYSDAIKELKYR